MERDPLGSRQTFCCALPKHLGNEGLHPATCPQVPLFGIFAELPFTPGSVLACGVAAALAWSSAQQCGPTQVSPTAQRRSASLCASPFLLHRLR